MVAPLGNRGARDLGFIGVDGDRDVTIPREGFDDGQDAAELLVDRHRIGARARGFAADVEDVGAIVDHLQPVGDGARRVEPPPAIGERVGRDVDDPHDERVRPEHQRSATGQRDGEAFAGDQ